MNRTKGFSAVKIVVALLVVVMMATVAWAGAFDNGIKLTGIDAITLKNSTGGTVSGAKSADIDVVTPGITVYYTDGPSVNYSLPVATNPGQTPVAELVTGVAFPINVSLTATYTSGVAGSIAWSPTNSALDCFMAGGNVAPTFKAGVAVSNSSTANIKVPSYTGNNNPSLLAYAAAGDVNSGGSLNIAILPVQVVVGTWFPQDNATWTPASYGSMFAGATYGVPPVVTSLDGRLTVSATEATLPPQDRPVKWVPGTVSISPKSANGINAAFAGLARSVAGKPDGDQAVLQFSGTPTAATATTFTVTGDVQENAAPGKVKLKSVTKQIVVTPKANPFVLTPSSALLRFRNDTAPTGDNVMTVAIGGGIYQNYVWNQSPGVIPTLYAGEDALSFTGGDAVGNGSTCKWNGMTITRNAAGTKQYAFTFTGVPNQIDSTTLFRVWGVLLNTSTANNYPILGAPFTVMVGSPTTPALVANPRSIATTVGTAMPTTTVYVTSTGGAVVMTGIGTTQNPVGIETSYSWNDLTITPNRTNNTIEVKGTPKVAGSQTYFIAGTAGGRTATNDSFTITATDPTAPSLKTSKNVTGVAGVAMSDPVTITSNITGGVISQLSLSQTSWNGLTFATNNGTSPVTVSGTPAAAGSTIVTVNGLVDGKKANSDSFTVTISPSATPTVSVSPTSLTYANGSYAGQTLSITTNNSTATPVVTAANSSILTVETVYGSGSNYTVSVRPASGFSYGTSDVNTSVTVSLSGATSRTVSVVLRGSGTPGSTLFVGSTQWSKIRNDTNKTYDLYMPVTSAFINAFDRNKDGRVTTDEISRILASVTAPYADLISSSTWFEMINNDSTSYGTLHLRLFFDPHSGHNLDWYVNLVLQALQVIGVNGADLSQIFGSGVTIESIRNYYTSGSSSSCSAGFAPFALLLLAPMVLRRKD